MTLNPKRIEFEKNPLYKIALRCRTYDEKGKDDINLLDTNSNL